MCNVDTVQGQEFFGNLPIVNDEGGNFFYKRRFMSVCCPSKKRTATGRVAALKMRTLHGDGLRSKKLRR